jgi:nicotinamidase-related amidase
MTGPGGLDRYQPGNAAIVVVDVQNDFCHPDGSLSRLGADVSAAQEMVPRLLGLIDAAHEADVPVVLVQTVHDATNDSPAWLARFDSQHRPGRGELVCRTGSWGAQLYLIAPRPEDRIVTKSRYSAFAGTNLDIQLRTLGVSSLLFTGVATETCVESSVRDGLFNDYYVSLVEDCSASYDSDAHEASAKVIARHFGTVVSSDRLRSRWRSPAVA